jgi:hypothetical protein
MTHEDYVRSKRAELARVADHILSDRIDLVEGCRQLVFLASGAEIGQDEDLDTIRAIESDLDHIPPDSSRSHYSGEYLRKIDRQKEAYLARTREDIMEACGRLAARFSSGQSPDATTGR